jgi:3',5'-cyclic AMP phosphodiesterase CpdA
MKIGVISDLHWNSDTSETHSWHDVFDPAGIPDRIRDAARVFREAACDALVCLGDLTEHGDRAALDDVTGLLAVEWPGPLLLVAGNHDDRELTEARFAELTGGRARISWPVDRVLLDGRSVSGRISGTAGADGPMRLVLSHYPLLSRRTLLEENGFKYAGDLSNRAELEGLLLARGVPTLVLSGHLHVRDSASRGAVLQLSVASLIEPPFESAVIDISANPSRVSITRISHSRVVAEPGRRLPIFSPCDEMWTYTPEGWRQRSE